ncbi:MAG: sigma-70 family RNA polymerase sigma factor [Pirellula sp.]|nr:sigma-70 family RNA polymerase sigma factor [Pirellula sp.]
MDKTSITLLDSLRDPENRDGWQKLCLLYQPLLLAWLKKYDVQSCDADDLIQDVLMSVCESIKSFEHSGRPGAFRAWLKLILVNRLRNFWRTRDRKPHSPGGSTIEQRLLELEDPASQLSQLWDQQHDLFVMKRLLEWTKRYFSAESWEVFVRVAIRGESAETVALERGVSLNSIFIAKSRILRRLRTEAAGLVDSSSRISLSN